MRVNNKKEVLIMRKHLSKALALTLAMSSLASVSLAEGSVLNVWCWNDEFQSRFNAYYPEVKEVAEDKSTTTLNDGTIVKWTINPNADNNYQNKLDEALLAQESAADDDKIDMFLIEADYALKYVDSPYTLDVRADIGLTDGDLDGQYKYTQDIATADGVLKGVTWQATPGLFAYRRSIAKDVLGTDDPAEVQTYLSDWNKFDEVAAKAAEKGYKMLSGYDDSYRTFSNNVSAPWVDGTTVKVDPNIMKWVEQTKDYTDKGYYYWGGSWMCAAAGTDNAETIKNVMLKLTCDKAIDKQITLDTQDYTNNIEAMNEIADSDYGSDFLGGQNHIALFAKSAEKIDMSNAGPYDQGLNENMQTVFHDYFNGAVDLETAKANFEAKIKVLYPELTEVVWPE